MICEKKIKQIAKLLSKKEYFFTKGKFCEGFFSRRFIYGVANN
jgi:hypothetical protein